MALKGSKLNHIHYPLHSSAGKHSHCACLKPASFQTHKGTMPHLLLKSPKHLIQLVPVSDISAWVLPLPPLLLLIPHVLHWSDFHLGFHCLGPQSPDSCLQPNAASLYLSRIWRTVTLDVWSFGVCSLRSFSEWVCVLCITCLGLSKPVWWMFGDEGVT